MRARAKSARGRDCRFREHSRDRFVSLTARWRVRLLAARLAFSMPSPSRPAPDDPPQSSFAEILPCADPNDAGTEWRATRLRDLAWRARCLGVHDAPEIQSALLAMREATAELDAMSIAQSSPSYHRPWWADGEYDEARAEAANDLGVASFRARDWSAAFDHHTEAIRLEPRRAVYHANRAAAA